ncbi:multicopper oxidase family protein [Janthinobacterium sp.]|uniref:multicopper oxidase family protein n=1 Tax=Janthinobacterium sp. TaxID=1871054 RepID=UPI002634C118|nr:multicopper oxidase family protein [Janthinobacterium sp.]
MSSRFARRHALLCLAAMPFACSAAFAAETNVNLNLDLNLKAVPNVELRLLQEPPTLKARARPASRAASRRDEFEKSYDLYIRYANGSIYNPTTAKHDKVRLRSYQQTDGLALDGRDEHAATFMAPTVVMAPGQTVRFKLHNRLKPLPAEQCATTDINAARPRGCFNDTNLHSHGLWVSPAGNSDNVLISIKPGVDFEYEYNIPIDHPAGTFWYHPHQHGATAMQVASGMAGALVVEGERYPTATANGDLDVMLKQFQPDDGGGSAGEVMLLQQIPYDCPSNSLAPTRPCDKDAVGVLEDFDQVEDPNAWLKSGRYTSVNGKVQPVLKMKTQRLYRWRLIDTGFQASVVLRIRRANDPQKLFQALGVANQDKDVMALCDGEDVTQFEVASDGLTHDRIIPKTLNYLQPGYRSDILFSLPKAGAYCVYAETNVNNMTTMHDVNNTRLIGVIAAKTNARASARARAGESPRDFLLAELRNAVRSLPGARLPDSVKSTILGDLDDGLKLGKFVPHASFSEAAKDAMRGKTKEYATFNIAKVDGKTRFMVEGKPEDSPTPEMKYVYDPHRVDHTLVLGTEQMWELASKNGNHPFHIHVNPFQIIGITRTDGGTVDAQYKDLIGTWKDTLLVMQGHKIEIATRYQRYIGEYVLHCHILEHEDQGMMQNVKVVLPDGKGGGDLGGHGH